jgi:hypothetical protein
MNRWVVACIAGAALAARAEGLDQLAWMAGTWLERKGATDTEEQWLAPKGGLMLGVGRTVKDGKAVEFELLRIEARDGKPVYLAMPQGRPATEFRAIEQSPGKVVFERDGDDFPKRVVYWREGESLRARIEGQVRGRARAREWRYESAR